MKDLYHLSLIFYPQDDGRYSVLCPELDGCISFGDTIDEAYERMKDLVPRFIVFEMKKNGKDIDMWEEGLAVPGKFFIDMPVPLSDVLAMEKQMELEETDPEVQKVFDDVQRRVKALDEIYGNETEDVIEESKVKENEKITSNT
jgi:predicted RNase H-like HicB family nuclease